jgi:hypothetical protein
MKKITTVLALTFIISLFSYTVSAQCKGFAKKICKLELIPYIHDGNYNAALMSEGEEADMYKTFYSNQQYRLAICGSDTAFQVEFKVTDSRGNILYNNREHNFSRIWDFKFETSQQVKITVKVPVSNKKKNDSEIVSGCVAILVGFKE